MPRVAVIGAGISGLSVAAGLRGHARVTVFEKSRGVGGRMSTRRAEGFQFDHGTQFITARSRAFQGFLAPMLEQGHIAPWSGKLVYLEPGRKPRKRLWFEPHLVAAPAMNSLCRQLAVATEVQLGVEVAPLAGRQSDGWHLTAADGTALGVYDWVVSTAPAPQSLRLLEAFVAADSPLRECRMKGCYALMIGLPGAWKRPWIAAKMRDFPLEWIAVNATRPGRDPAASAIVALSGNDWAQEHIDDPPERVQRTLLSAFEAVTGVDCADAAYLACHRWRYALVEDQEPCEALLDPGLGLACVGDWCSASRVEDAWQSSMQLLERLRPRLSGPLAAR